MHDFTEEQLDTLGKQFTVIYRMTFTQFVEAVRNNKIQINFEGRDVNEDGTFKPATSKIG